MTTQSQRERRSGQARSFSLLAAALSIVAIWLNTLPDPSMSFPSIICAGLGLVALALARQADRRVVVLPVLGLLLAVAAGAYAILSAAVYFTILPGIVLF